MTDNSVSGRTLPPFPPLVGCPRQKIYAPLVTAQRVEVCVKLQAEEAQVDGALYVGSSDTVGSLEVGSLATPEGRNTAGMHVEWPLPATKLWRLEAAITPAAGTTAASQDVGAAFLDNMPQSAHTLRLQVFPMPGKTLRQDAYYTVRLRPSEAEGAALAKALASTGELEAVPVASFVGAAGSLKLLPLFVKFLRGADGKGYVELLVGWAENLARGDAEPQFSKCADIAVHLRFVRKPQ